MLSPIWHAIYLGHFPLKRQKQNNAMSILLHRIARIPCHLILPRSNCVIFMETECKLEQK